MWRDFRLPNESLAIDLVAFGDLGHVGAYDNVREGHMVRAPVGAQGRGARRDGAADGAADWRD